MKQLKLLYLLPFLLSCSFESEHSVIDKKEPALLKSDSVEVCDLSKLHDQNFLTLYYNNQEFRFNHLECFSKKVGDTIILNLLRGFGPVDYVSIRVINHQFLIDYSRENEGYSSKFNTLTTSMFYCPDNIIPNDTANFNITYKGICATEFGTTDTAKIEGNFKAKIHGISYDYETYRFERDSLKMVDLMNQRGIDTIKEVNFSRCGLRYLPAEISKFNNLEYLTLNLNDLSQEDFHLLGTLKKLKYLSIQRCNITIFPKFLVELSCLEELNISTNKITFIPSKILSMKNIKTLDVHGNKGLRIEVLNKNNTQKIKIMH